MEIMPGLVGEIITKRTNIVGGSTVMLLIAALSLSQPIRADNTRAIATISTPEAPSGAGRRNPHRTCIQSSKTANGAILTQAASS